mgnify:CR=1 FL=1
MKRNINSRLLENNEMNRSIFSKLKLLLFHPTAFFQDVMPSKDENGPILWAFLSLILFGILNSVLFFIVQAGLISFPRWSVLVDLNNVGVFAYGLVVYVFWTIMELVTIPLTHFIVKKFGGKGSRYDTIKSIFYPYT